MLLPVDVTPLLSNAFKYSSAIDFRCSSVMVRVVIAIMDSEQSRRGVLEGNAEMFVGETRHDSAAGRRWKEADLQQIRLVHVFDRIDFFAKDGRNRAHSDRSAIESLDDRAKQLAVDIVEALLIDIQQLQRAASHLRGDFSVAFPPGIAANTLQQTVGDARRAPTTFRDFRASVGRDHGTEDF